MNTSLTIRNEVSLELWNVIREIAPVAKDSRLFGVATAEQAMMIMLKGKELGLSLTASFEFVTVIENKPALIPRGALALILNSPLCAGVEIKDETDDKGVPTACSVTMKRKNGFSYTARFSMADAQRAGLVKDKSGWEKYPANMMRARAIGFCADIVFPDVIGGMKRADELGADLDPNGDIVEGSWSVAPQQVQPQTGSQSTPQTVTAPVGETVSQSQQPAFDPNRLQTLLNTYGAAAIMDANGGKIPGTDAELDAIETELEVTGAK